MAASVNKVIIVGRLGQDPELRYTTSNQPIARFTVATSEVWTDKNTGEKQERTEWHRVVVWGRLAELCRDYLKKGRQVYIDGKLQTRTWEDSSGNKRYTTEIVANNIVFLGSAKNADAVYSVNNSDTTSIDNFTADTVEEAYAQDSGVEEDIPF